jgi:hypothetical protein
MDKRHWLDADFVIQKDPLRRNISVLREDLLAGGTKLRFLPFLCEGAREVVYASPFCGGAQVALAELGLKTGKRITIFAAQRREPHEMQRRAMEKGARFVPVPHGYLSNVTAKARAYASEKGALYLPLGFDVPIAQEAYREFLWRVKDEIQPEEIWVAAGSGMLARALAQVFKMSTVVAVVVGRSMRNSAGMNGNERGLFPITESNITYQAHYLPFDKPTHYVCPFPSCANYDRKAWEFCDKYSNRKKKVLFVNVLG